MRVSKDVKDCMESINKKQLESARNSRAFARFNSNTDSK